MAPPSDGPNARGFATDAATERALRAGLAGRGARVQRARLGAALRALMSEPASRLVLVDLDGVPEPETAARELVAVCAFGTALIAIGSTDTAALTRTLFRQGFADYLVKPLSPAAVREASAAALEDLPERPYAGHVVAFAGTAGSGVSTLVAAVARSAAAGGSSTAVVDLDPAAGALPFRLGAEPAGDLATLLAALDPGPPPEPDEAVGPGEPAGGAPSLGPGGIDEISAPAGAGIALVAYPPAGPLPAPPSPDAVRALLERLANRTHTVLVTGVPDPGPRTAIMQGADTRILLYEPTLPSISAAVHCLARLGADYPVTLVQCHPRMPRGALSRAHIRHALADRGPDVVVPFDPALHAAATGQGRARSPGKAYRAALRQVVERVVEGAAPAGA